MIAVDQRDLEEEVNFLLHYFAPIVSANTRRDDVAEFIKRVLTDNMAVSGITVVGCGSSALRSFLPDSDMDVVVLCPDIYNTKEEMKTLQHVFTALCDEIATKDEGKSKYHEFTIRNVEFINARTKVAHCVVNNINVDMTVNQIGALSCMLFLEECDRLIGFNHLFKRSLILVKAWCLNESSQYSGLSVSGSKLGMLSSYAISIMVLHLFNKFTTNLTHPFSVLRCFLFTYMAFPWETHVLTLDGPQPILNGSLQSQQHQALQTSTVLFPNRFRDILANIKAANSPSCGESPITTAGIGGSNCVSSINSSGKTTPRTSFPTTSPSKGFFGIRACNIQDPVDVNNNLGTSVSRYNLMLLQKALQLGHLQLENIIIQYSNVTTVNPQMYFAPGTSSNSTSSSASGGIASIFPSPSGTPTAAIAAAGVGSGGSIAGTTSVGSSTNGKLGIVKPFPQNVAAQTGITNKLNTDQSGNSNGAVSTTAPGRQSEQFYSGGDDNNESPPNTVIAIAPGATGSPSEKDITTKSPPDFVPLSLNMKSEINGAVSASVPSPTSGSSATSSSNNNNNNNKYTPPLPIPLQQQQQQQLNSNLHQHVSLMQVPYTLSYPFSDQNSGCGEWRYRFLQLFFPNSSRLLFSNTTRQDMLDHPMQQMQQQQQLQQQMQMQSGQGQGQGNLRRPSFEQQSRKPSFDAMANSSKSGSSSGSSNNSKGVTYKCSVDCPFCCDVNNMWTGLNNAVKLVTTPSTPVSMPVVPTASCNQQPSSIGASSVVVASAVSADIPSLPTPPLLMVSTGGAAFTGGSQNIINNNNNNYTSSNNDNNNNNSSTGANKKGKATLNSGRSRCTAVENSFNTSPSSTSVSDLQPPVEHSLSSCQAATLPYSSSDSNERDRSVPNAETNINNNNNNNNKRSSSKSDSKNGNITSLKSNSAISTPLNRSLKYKHLRQGGAGLQLSEIDNILSLGTGASDRTDRTDNSSASPPENNSISPRMSAHADSFDDPIDLGVYSRRAGLNDDVADDGDIEADFKPQPTIHHELKTGATSTSSNENTNATTASTTSSNAAVVRVSNSSSSSRANELASWKEIHSGGKKSKKIRNNNSNNNNDNDNNNNKNSSHGSAGVSDEGGTAIISRASRPSKVLETVRESDIAQNSGSSSSSSNSSSAVGVVTETEIQSKLIYKEVEACVNDQGGGLLIAGQFYQYSHLVVLSVSIFLALSSALYWLSSNERYQSDIERIKFDETKHITDIALELHRLHYRRGSSSSSSNKYGPTDRGVSEDMEIIPTHWISLGDSISFGDFSSLGVGYDGGRVTNSSPATVAIELVGQTDPDTDSQMIGGVNYSASDHNGGDREETSVTRLYSYIWTKDGVDLVYPSTADALDGNQILCHNKSDCDTYANTCDSEIASKYSGDTSKCSDGTNRKKSSNIDSSSDRANTFMMNSISNASSAHPSLPYYSLRTSKLSDAGHYQCFKLVPLGNGVNTIRVLVTETIIQISQIPRVNTKPSYQELKAGKSLFLSLAVEGYPPPSYQWYKNGYALEEVEAQLASYYVESVNASHSGTYSCEVSNIAGSVLWLEATVRVV